MKILIITSNRSGSTYLYQSLMEYVAPKQKIIDNGHTIEFNEAISEDWSLLRNKNNVAHVLSYPNWVIKILVEDINNDRCGLMWDLYKQCDIAVKLTRNRYERTISRMLAKIDDNWDYKGVVDTKDWVVDYDTIVKEVDFTNISSQQLFSMPADLVIDYKQLDYPRQIYGLVTGEDINKLIPIQPPIKQNTIVLEWDQIKDIESKINHALKHTLLAPSWGEEIDYDRYLGKQ